MLKLKISGCAQKGCTALVTEGRGYCNRHGGPVRAARENRAAAAEAVRPLAPKVKKTLADLKVRREEFRHGVTFDKNGAPVGQGLSWFVRQK